MLSATDWPLAWTMRTCSRLSSRAWPEAGLDQRIDNPWRRLVDRKSHVVGERLRRGARASLAAVDHEEVGRELQAAAVHDVGHLVHEAPAADRGLDAHRPAGQL